MRVHTNQFLNPTGGTNLKGKKNQVHPFFWLALPAYFYLPIISAAPDRSSNRELISVIYRDTLGEKWTSSPFKPIPWNGMRMQDSFPK